MNFTKIYSLNFRASCSKFWFYYFILLFVIKKILIMTISFSLFTDDIFSIDCLTSINGSKKTEKILPNVYKPILFQR